MEFVIFQRADSALLVVPALFQPPLACQLEGPVDPIGRCEIDLDAFSSRVAAELAERGFAHVEGDDWRLLRPFLAPDATLDVPAVVRASPAPAAT